MAKASVVVPAILATLLLCALILLTCAYFSYPQYFIRIGRPADEESMISEKVVVVPTQQTGLLGRFGLGFGAGGSAQTPAADVVTANPHDGVQIIEPTPDGIVVVDAEPEEPRRGGRGGWFS